MSGVSYLQQILRSQENWAVLQEVLAESKQSVLGMNCPETIAGDQGATRKNSPSNGMEEGATCRQARNVSQEGLSTASPVSRGE